MTGQLLTAEEVARRWQVRPSHVYRLAREHQIPTVKLGRYVRFHPGAIEAFERGETAENSNNRSSYT